MITQHILFNFRGALFLFFPSKLKGFNTLIYYISQIECLSKQHVKSVLKRYLPSIGRRGQQLKKENSKEHRPIRTLKTKSSLFAGGLVDSAFRKDIRVKLKTHMWEFDWRLLNVSGWMIPVVTICWLAAEALGVAVTGVWPAGAEEGLSPFSSGAAFGSFLRSTQASASSWRRAAISHGYFCLLSCEMCQTGPDLRLSFFLHVVQRQSRQLFGPLLQQVDVSDGVGQSLDHICGQIKSSGILCRLPLYLTSLNILYGK